MPAPPTRSSKIADGPGYVDETTEIVLQYHDAHVPDGAFDVTFEDVGGLSKQIKLIRELVQLPLSHPQVYRHLGINPPRGLILYGPPGAGKSHLARAVANEVDARFYYINGPDVIGTYTGETEANLRRMFSEAGHHAPSIIFIDELDAMAPKRGETGAHADTRTVTQLLALMDGLKRVDCVIVIGTTNRIDAVDPGIPPARPVRPRDLHRSARRRRPARDPGDPHPRNAAVGRRAGPSRRNRQAHPRLPRRRLDGIMPRRRTVRGCAAAPAICRTIAPHSAFRSRICGSSARTSRLALAQTRPSALRETLISVPDVSWSDIGGLETSSGGCRRRSSCRCATRSS